MIAPPTSPTDRRSATTHMALKIFGYVVLLLIAISILYSIWIAISNWNHIGV